MGTMASQITSLAIVFLTVYSGADQSSASLAFVRGIDRWPVNSLHKGPVTRGMLPYDDAIMTRLCVFGSLWLSDDIWWRRSRSTLAQVTACWLTTPNRYLNQCWLIISEVQWQSQEDNFTRDSSATQFRMKITYLQLHSNVSSANEF